jgi:carbonic anhydrase
VDSILPALGGIDAALPPPVRLAQAVESNVRWTVRQIAESPEGQVRRAEGRMQLVGAVYEIESGRVRILAEGMAGR